MNIQKEKTLKVPIWFTVLFIVTHVTLIVGAYFLFGLFASAIVLLFLSASFIGYLAEAYTHDFRIASLAKSISIIVGITGIVMLFLSVSWWGILGVIGWWLLIVFSMAFWQKHISFRFFQ